MAAAICAVAAGGRPRCGGPCWRHRRLGTERRAYGRAQWKHGGAAGAAAVPGSASAEGFSWADTGAPPSAFFEASVPLRSRSCPNLIVSLPPAANCGAVRLRRSLRHSRGRWDCSRAGRSRPERRRALASARAGGGGGGRPAEGDRWLVYGRGMPGFGRARPNRAEALSPRAAGAGGAASRGGTAAGSGGQRAGRPRVTGRL